MSFFSISRLLSLVFTTGTALNKTSAPPRVLVPTTGTALNTTFTMPRFAMTSWDTPAAGAGVRLFGTTPDTNGFLELKINGRYDPGSTTPPPWESAVRMRGTFVVLRGSDFAAVSSPDGAQIIVFFFSAINNMFVYGNWSSTTASFGLGFVGGGAAPFTGSSLGAGMWGPNHLSVFHQSWSGMVYESEYLNGRWASARPIALANLRTDINVVSAGGSARAVYLQEGTMIQEWSWSQSTGTWTNTTLTNFTAQSTNIRMVIPYLSNDSPPGRIYYAAGGGTIARTAGRIGSWGPFASLDPVQNMANSSDISSTLQFPSPGGPVIFMVYSAADGKLWQALFQPYVGWLAPILLTSST